MKTRLLKKLRRNLRLYYNEKTGNFLTEKHYGDGTLRTETHSFLKQALLQIHTWMQYHPLYIILKSKKEKPVKKRIL